MKNSSILLVIALWCCCANTRLMAQTSDWQTGNSTNTEVTAIQQKMAGLFQALNAGDMDKANAFYSDKATILMTSGSIIFNKNTVIETWKSQIKMLDELPKFSYDNLQVRLLGRDVALVVYQVEVGFKYQGNTTSNSATATDVLQKSNGQWLIELEQMTPVTQPPTTGN